MICVLTAVIAQLLQYSKVVKPALQHVANCSVLDICWSYGRLCPAALRKCLQVKSLNPEKHAPGGKCPGRTSATQVSLCPCLPTNA